MYIVVSNCFGIEAKIVSVAGDNPLSKALRLVRKLAEMQLENYPCEENGCDMCCPINERLSEWDHGTEDGLINPVRDGYCPACLAKDEVEREDWPYYYYVDLNAKKYRVVFPYWEEEEVVSFNYINNSMAFNVLCALAELQRAIESSINPKLTVGRLVHDNNPFGSYAYGVHPDNCITQWAKLAWPHVVKTDYIEESIGGAEQDDVRSDGKVHVLVHDSEGTDGFIDVDNDLNGGEI